MTICARFPATSLPCRRRSRLPMMAIPRALTGHARWSSKIIATSAIVWISRDRRTCRVIADQREDYLLKALREYKSGARHRLRRDDGRGAATGRRCADRGAGLLPGTPGGGPYNPMQLAGLFAQILNGLQYGLLLFLISSGLTLIFGVMRVINLAHGSLFMIGAYLAYVLAGVDRLALARAARRAGRRRAVRRGAGIHAVPPLPRARASRPGAADLRADPAVRGSAIGAWWTTSSTASPSRRCWISPCV